MGNHIFWSRGQGDLLLLATSSGLGKLNILETLSSGPEQAGMESSAHSTFGSSHCIQKFKTDITASEQVKADRGEVDASDESIKKLQKETSTTFEAENKEGS